MPKRIDLTGQRFGRLVVEGFAYMDKNRHSMWNCRCDCGGHNIASIANLRRGNVKSCGCLRHICYTKTHGDSKSRLWYIWRGIKKRTGTATDKDFKNYGGRGIVMCEDWQNFLTFKNWAISHGYCDDLTIDRIDVNGDYCPKNCRWIPMEKQAENKRNNVRYLYNGENLTLSEWARRIGMTSSGLWGRIHTRGWSIEKAIETPVEKHNMPKRK